MHSRAAFAAPRRAETTESNRELQPFRLHHAQPVLLHLVTLSATRIGRQTFERAPKSQQSAPSRELNSGTDRGVESYFHGGRIARNQGAGWNDLCANELSCGAPPMEDSMRRLALGFAACALFALPLPASAGLISTDLSAQSIEVGPGGVRVEERRQRQRVNCRELRSACLNKERLGEQGEGNCRRYRSLCR
jgi:hypothetical protein